MFFPEKIHLKEIIKEAESKMLMKDWDGAISLWNEIIKSFKDFPREVFLRKAKCYLFKFEYENALLVLEDAYDFFPEEERYKVNDLVAVIRSASAKKYLFEMEYISKKINFNLEGNVKKIKLAKYKELSDFLLAGWFGIPCDLEAKVAVQYKNSSVEIYDFNVLRPDVVYFFSEKGNNFKESCGFRIKLNFLNCEKLGVYFNGEIDWCVKFNFTEVLGVIRGRDNWLFLDNDSNRSVDQFTGVLNLNKSNIEKWRIFSKNLNRVLDGYNYNYLIASSKENIFPEKYPFEKCELSFSAKVKEIFLQESVKFIDPSSLLKLSKYSYHETDTHWSDIGGYIAYCEWMRVNGFEDDIVSVEFFDVWSVGDLGSKVSPIEKSIRKTHKYNSYHSECVFDNFVEGTGSFRIFYNKNAKNKSKILMFGGSSLSSGSLFNYFSYSFEKVFVINLPGSIILDLVNHVNPDYILIQTNERYMINPGEIFEKIEETEVVKKTKKLSFEKKDKLISNIKQYSDYFYEKVFL